MIYFAWVRERIGRGEEELSPPESVRDVAGLLDWLEGCGEGYAAAFADRARLRMAVNQDYAGPETPIGPEDEVAIFPPVTGG